MRNERDCVTCFYVHSIIDDPLCPFPLSPATRHTQVVIMRRQCVCVLSADLSPVNKLYNWSLKSLLDVRGNTCNDLCYIESGYPPLKVQVKKRQRMFFASKWEER